MNKEDLKNLLFSFGQADYCINVDLHIRSGNSDGEMAPDEIIEQAKELKKKYCLFINKYTA